MRPLLRNTAKVMAAVPIICFSGRLCRATSGVPRIFFGGGGGVQQIQLRTEDRENGDLGAVAP